MCIDGFLLHSVRISWFSDLFRSSNLWVVTGCRKCMKPPPSGRTVFVTGPSETMLYAHARAHTHSKRSPVQKFLSCEACKQKELITTVSEVSVPTVIYIC